MEVKSENSQLLHCNVCGEGFISNLSLQRHVKAEHSHKAYECDICHKKFGDKYSLKVHYRIHTGEKPYVCQYCGNSFAQACNLLTHKRKYHFRKMQQSGMKMKHLNRFHCPQCKMIFPKPELVKAHILSQHGTRKVNRVTNNRSPSTSSGVSSTSSNSERGVIKQENHIGIRPNMILHCKKCRLTFPDRVNYQKHMYAHAKQQQMQRHLAAAAETTTTTTTQVQVSNSSGKTINLKELVSKIKEESPLSKARSQEEVMQKLSGLGMEISLQPIQRKSEKNNDLGLVISSVQSVSQSFFDQLENPNEKPKSVINQKPFITKPPPRKILRTNNGVNGFAKKINRESPVQNALPASTEEECDPLDPLALPSTTSLPPAQSTPKWKKPKTEPDSSKKLDGDIILSSTRRTSRAVAYNEADQPKYISILTKQKNGKTTKRRIFPCGQCTCKFENIETRKMHFLTVHASARNRNERTTLENDPPHPPPPPTTTIISEIIPAYEDHDD